jgi:hypothetical protein
VATAYGAAGGWREVGLSLRRAGLGGEVDPRRHSRLRFLRERLGAKVHFWPFDGWAIPCRRSAIAEVYPALWSRGFAQGARTADQHDAFSIAAWLAAADRSGSLSGFLQPGLTEAERAVARVEGWILGVAGTLDVLASGGSGEGGEARGALH